MGFVTSFFGVRKSSGFAALCAILIAGVATTTSVPASANPVAKVVTAKVLGTPSSDLPVYARNVWDLKSFAGKLYVGYGNSANGGPASNAGPIPIVSYQGPSGFTREFTTFEEQVDVFRVIDGQLVVPGHDPVGGGGRLYRLGAEGWTVQNRVPNGIHLYDVASFDGKLFVATGGGNSKAIIMSKDNGSTWTGVLETPMRIHSFYELNGKLYANGLGSTQFPGIVSSWVYNGSKFVEVGADGKNAALFPGESFGRWQRMVRATPVGNRLIYIGADGVNDHQWDPRNLYVTTQIGKPSRINLGAGVVPYDIVTGNGVTYVLGSSKNPDGTYRNSVWKSNDLSAWTPLFHFNTSTFARSFEERGGNFFFGLGTNVSPLAADSGQILTVRKAQYTTKSTAPTTGAPTSTTAAPTTTTTANALRTTTTTMLPRATTTTNAPRTTTSTTKAPTTTTVLPTTTTTLPSAIGYRLVAGDASAVSRGTTGSATAPSLSLARPIVGGTTGTTPGAYWLVASDGGVFSFGGARFLGSTGGMRLSQPMVGMAATPTGAGYWTVAADGGVFAFGDARFFGSTGALKLNRPIVAMAATPTGNGYWLVASDGGVFSFGDAAFLGSTGDLHLVKPITAMAPSTSGMGYSLLASDGGIFSFGDSRFFGSLGDRQIPGEMVGMTGTASGNGYWLASRTGHVFPFGDAAHLEGWGTPNVVAILPMG